MARPFVSVLTSAAIVLPALAVPASAQAPGGRMYDPSTSAGVGQQVISCQSFNGRYQECNLPVGTQSVQIAQQFSRDPCIEGQTWGRRGLNMWVSNGCRATFTAYQGGAYPGTPNPPYPGVPNRPYPGQQGQYAGQLECNARFGEQYCGAPTQNRVDVLRVVSGQCAPGRDWSYDERGIRVRNGCRAVFGYGFAGGASGTTPPTYPGYPGQQGQQGQYAGQIVCQSRGFGGDQFCPAPTQNRVDVLQVQRGQCQPGRDWSYDQNGIRVRNGCQALFGYGYQQANQGGGISTGGAIAGVAVAAGLIALLASRGKSNRPSAGVAAIDADFNAFPRDVQREARACLNEAARQVGATGGQRVALSRVDGVSREGNGWRLLARLTGAYDNRASDLDMACVASGDRVLSFDVR